MFLHSTALRYWLFTDPFGKNSWHAGLYVVVIAGFFCYFNSKISGHEMAVFTLETDFPSDTDIRLRRVNRRNVKTGPL